jgi:hypothetical protein
MQRASQFIVIAVIGFFVAAAFLWTRQDSLFIAT